MATSQTPSRRVLVADDDDRCRRLLADTLKDDGFVVIEAQDGFELVKLIAPALGGGQHQVKFDLIVSSVRLRGWWAIDVVAKLSEHMLLPPVILIVRPDDESLRGHARQLRGVVIFDQPFDPNALRAMVRSLLP